MASERPKSQIPVGSQFTPALIDLPNFIAALIANAGDKEQLEAAVWQPSVRKDKKKHPTKRNRSLPVEAAIQYGLLEKKTYAASDLTKDLAKLSGNALNEAFARHILLECGGLRVCEGCIQMEADGLPIGGDPLSRYLSAQGFFVAEHNTAINSLRMWLAEAAIFPKKGWTVNVANRDRVLGMTGDTIQALAGFSDEQVQFALALCRINPVGWYPAASVRENAEAYTGQTFNRASARKNYLEDLKHAGMIDFRTRGISGGKTAELKTTKKFEADLLQQFLDVTLKTLDPSLASYFVTRPADIFAGMNSEDTDEKGRALEAFAVYVMRLLGLRFRGWRVRARETTGGGEVDALLSGTLGVAPMVWQVQCKNTPSGAVRLRDVASEVGISLLTGATHILLIANCQFTKDAKDFAHKINSTPLSPMFFLIDKAGFDEMRRDPAALSGLLKQQAARIEEARGGGTGS